ncbi:tRNA (cytidine(34)-2'-O)-methyltransferase [Brachybacterium horti]
MSCDTSRWSAILVPAPVPAGPGVHAMIAIMVHVFFHNPVIAGNTGNAIRLAAVTGARLHLIEPLGFDLEDAKLRRAGLDYHDLAEVRIHPDLETALAAVPDSRVFAFTARASTSFERVEYRREDVLLFGTEPTGLPEEAMTHPRVNDRVRIPMLPARRSLNLANSASIAVYEAWRQLGFDGAGA